MAPGAIDTGAEDPNPVLGLATGTEGGGSERAPLSLSPRVVLFWRLPWVILTGLVAVVAALGVALSDATTAWAVVLVVALVLGGLVATILPRARYRRWRYWVTDEGIELRHGVMFRSESSIPHFRVQHIDIRQGPLQRAAGVVELVISTASAATDATLPGVEPERAASIRQVVLARAEADDAV